VVVQEQEELELMAILIKDKVVVVQLVLLQDHLVVVELELNLLVELPVVVLEQLELHCKEDKVEPETLVVLLLVVEPLVEEMVLLILLEVVQVATMEVVVVHQLEPHCMVVVVDQVQDI
tara:strand:- start:46 stop:402 length:357 start_codon:yes stop_codon:yes gene_type:complete